MIPIADDNPTYTRPYVTYTIIALNVLVFVLDWMSRDTLSSRFSAIPFSVVHDVRMVPAVAMGQLVFARDPSMGPHPQWITIFTAMFLHGGFMHLGGNMLYLWIFGNNIEDVLGHVKYAIFYVICGLIAAGAHIFMNPNSPIPMVGASGAIAGVLGAYILLYPRATVHTLIPIFYFMTMAEIPAIFVLGMWFLLQLSGVAASGGLLYGGVAYWAHIGGFIAGLVIVLFMGGRNLTGIQRLRRDNYNRPYPFRPWQ